jgi:hypothetical protein
LQLLKCPNLLGIFGPSIDGEIGAPNMGGGVRSPIRTGLDPELPDKWPFAGNFRELLPVTGKLARIRCINSMTYKRIP